MIKIIMIALLALTLTNCAQNTYKVKQEAKDEGRVLNQVPQWYIDAKVDKGFIFKKDANLYIYSVGQGNSPDLQLAIEKAMMIAKAELADKLHGQMNKRTDLYITEVGNEGNKQVASKIEETIVNIVKKIGAKFKLSHKDNGEPKLVIGSNKKLAKLINWKPRISINEGIKSL